MLIEEDHIQRKIKVIVARICHSPSLHDDLVQEAAIHLWQTERLDPGHTESWYLQSCDFHLRKLMQAGKSVDSSKRRALRIGLLSERPDEEDSITPYQFRDDSADEQVCVRDLIRELLSRLNRLDRRILLFLVEGDNPSEIARRLGVSHTSVANHRRRIMLLALQLGLVCGCG